MKGLHDITEQIDNELDEKDTVREVAIKSSRAVIRLSSAAIRSIHRNEDYRGKIMEAKEEALSLRGLLNEHPDLYHAGFVENALQELVEACLLIAVIEGSELPGHKDLSVTGTVYLLGLSDLVGELRRLALEAMRRGEISEAEEYLAKMEDIYDNIMRFDYPNALVAIRRKQDIARSLIEKTRGEIAVASRAQSLEAKIDELRSELEGRQPPRNP